MNQTVAIYDQTTQNLSRVFMSYLRRQNNGVVTTYMGDYPNVRVQEGGLMTPDFPSTATVILMIDPVLGLDELWAKLDEFAPLLGRRHKLLVVEHHVGVYPNMQLDEGGRPWWRESWLNSHYARMRFNLREYELKLLCSIIVEVMQSSWTISGGDSYLGRFSRAQD